MSMAFMKKYIHVAKGIKVSKNRTAIKCAKSATMLDN